LLSPQDEPQDLVVQNRQDAELRIAAWATIRANPANESVISIINDLSSTISQFPFFPHCMALCTAGSGNRIGAIVRPENRSVTIQVNFAVHAQRK
jgi:hypothetical protein